MGSYNIGPKIGIEGEKEFLKQIKDINDIYNALEAVTRAVTAAFDTNGDEQGKLEASSKQLQKQIDMQKSKIDLLQDAINKATAKYGENSVEATRLKGALYDTQATVAGLEAELKDTQNKLEQTGEALEDVADNAEDAGDSVVGFSDILEANLASDLIVKGLEKAADIVGEFASGTIEAASSVKAANSQFSQSFGDLEDTARNALAAISSDTNIAATRMQESYTRIFAFAKTTGAESDDALNIASRAMVAAADSAAYYDKSIEEVTETIQAFLKGNYANDAALGISATEVSRNTMANQLYAKSFQELAESQKVDVLLAMVEAGNAASGALGQAARESDSWENVTGELSEAYRQLQAQVGKPVLEKVTPVIQKITKAAYELIDNVDWDQFGETISDVADAFIDNGPVILKTIASLATGLLTFTAVYKSQELFNFAKGLFQIGTAAKTAGSAVATSGAVAAASPWGLAAAAIGAAVALITISAIEAETSVSELERSSERLKNAFEDAEETYQETTSEINGAATAAEYYIQRLYELEAAGLDNAVANREYEMTVEALNELIPDLNLAIDEQTGLVNANKDALLADVAAWKENATAKALQEKFKDELEAQARAQADIITAQARINSLNRQAAPFENELNEVTEKRLSIYKELQKARSDYEKFGNRYSNEQASEAISQMQILENDLRELDLRHSELTATVNQFNREEEKLQSEIDEASEVMLSYEDDIQAAKDAMQIFNEETANSPNGLTDLEIKMQSVQGEVDELVAAYTEAKTAAKESIESQIGLFDELKGESDWTAEKILSNWEAQQKAFGEYKDNLNKAKELGLDDAIIEQLSDGREESMQILAAMVNDSNTRVADINKAFESLDKSKDSLSCTLTDIKIDFTESMEEIAADARKYGVFVGSNFVAGITEGFGKLPETTTEKIVNTFRYGKTSGFPFENDSSGFSSGYLSDLNSRLGRAGSYPAMYDNSSTVQTSATTKTVSLGGVSIQINAQPGQDVYEIAQAVQEVLQTEINREEAGL